MAKKELPKANLGKIISSVIKGGYQGIKTGYKSYKAASLAEKAAKLKKIQAAARAQKAAATRAANTKAANTKAANAAKNSKPGTPKPGTPKPGTPKPGTPKGKDPFVKSKARVATENVVGKVIGGVPFYTANATKKFLTSKYGVGITLGALTYGAANRWNKTNAPKKVKKYKKK